MNGALQMKHKINLQISPKKQTFVANNIQYTVIVKKQPDSIMVCSGCGFLNKEGFCNFAFANMPRIICYKPERIFEIIKQEEIVEQQCQNG
jgi:hypothetical protein